MDNTDNIQVHQSPLKEKQYLKICHKLVFLPCRIFSSCIRLFNRFKSFGGNNSLISRVVYSPGHKFSTQAKRHFPSLKQTSMCVRTQLLNK
jgi:hypothetical protein